MFGLFMTWLSQQVPLYGPFAWAVDRGWIAPETAEWFREGFFAPLNQAAENSSWVDGRLRQLVEMWLELPFL